MPKWKIPVVWSMTATIEIEAGSIEEAIEVARDKNNQIPLPMENASYLEDSWDVAVDSPD